MRKDNNIINEIAIDMMCNEKNMKNIEDVISDDVILKKIELLIDIEQRDNDGRTLLINSVCYERVKIVKFLLNRGADINIQDDMGFTALHFAVNAGNLEIIDLLLSYGAAVNSKNFLGNSPIMLARHSYSLEIFKLLKKYGADVCQKNNFGVSPMDKFVAYPKIIEILK